jgi:ABC-type Fe3+ transport system substrate-binding protein
MLARLIFVVAAALIGAGAHTAGEPPSLASYLGADREQRLLEGARKEGEIALYTSLTVEDMAALNGAFEQRYGIKVRMWRTNADKVLQRALAEARAGRFEADVFELNSIPLESLHREALLLPVRSPSHAELIPQAVPAHREWVGSRLNVFVQAYNTRLVKKEELPRSFADLADARWKGRLAIEAGDEDWFAAVVKELGEREGLALFRAIARNGISVRRGHTLLANLVASGEVPLALTVYNFSAQQLKQKGAPFDWFVLAPAVARANGVAVARRAPHPHAALLYYDFMIGEEGQRILAEREFVPSSRRIETPLHRLPLKLVDPAEMLDQSERWTRLFEEILLRQTR